MKSNMKSELFEEGAVGYRFSDNTLIPKRRSTTAHYEPAILDKARQHNALTVWNDSKKVGPVGSVTYGCMTFFKANPGDEERLVRKVAAQISRNQKGSTTKAGRQAKADEVAERRAVAADIQSRTVEFPRPLHFNANSGVQDYVSTLEKLEAVLFVSCISDEAQLKVLVELGRRIEAHQEPLDSNWLEQPKFKKIKQEISPDSCPCWGIELNDVTKSLIGIARRPHGSDEFNIMTAVKTIVDIAKEQNSFTGIYMGFSSFACGSNMYGRVHTLTAFCSLAATALATGDTTTLHNLVRRMQAARSGKCGGSFTYSHIEYQAFCHSCNNGFTSRGATCAAPDHLTVRSEVSNMNDDALFSDLRGVSNAGEFQLLSTSYTARLGIRGRARAVLGFPLATPVRERYSLLPPDCSKGAEPAHPAIIAVLRDAKAVAARNNIHLPSSWLETAANLDPTIEAPAAPKTATKKKLGTIDLTNSDDEDEDDAKPAAKKTAVVTTKKKPETTQTLSIDSDAESTIDLTESDDDAASAKPFASAKPSAYKKKRKRIIYDSDDSDS